MALSGGLHITSANQQQRRPKMMIAVGVDTHKHEHLAVAVDALGQLLAEITITATLAGYRELIPWITALEGEVRVARRRGPGEHPLERGVQDLRDPAARRRAVGAMDRANGRGVRRAGRRGAFAGRAAIPGRPICELQATAGCSAGGVRRPIVLLQGFVRSEE